ncbi:glycoside hydrolase family 3 N-terminal domain-containing protein [uncultured Jatrophihabitans sp.]|uniref:glycoside hydrolase family 3 N-terminal domain-containing protein n=1 Tax=uncultured Jatrophihabitans sp. TaxID=1610747 RepID=UPI0035CBC50A
MPGLFGRLRTKSALVGAAVVALGVVGVGAASSSDAAPGVYQDPHASPNARAADLVKRLSLDEQLGQMVQIQVGHLYGDCTGYNPGPLNAGCAQQVLGTDHVGSILSGGGDVPGEGYYPNTPQTWASQINTMERYAINHSRYHIPIVYGADVVHGHNDVVGTTLFPQQIGLGSSFDPSLVTKVQSSASRAAAATNVRWAFAPVADVDTNSRWGRYYESFGEDPTLDGTMSAAAVDGLQSQPDVAATVKHFAGYGASDSGLDRTAADTSLRNFQTYQLPSYAKAVHAGALSVMVNSASINGVPATGSKYLLNNLLRKQLGFNGVVISDWQDVMALQTKYHVVDSYEAAIARAVNAGIDVTMEPYDADGFLKAAHAAVNDHLISRARIKQAAQRVLAMKFKLGLFDHPYVNANQADKVLGANTELARTAAQESSVLVRNENSTLPLAPSSKIVVTGPAADSVADTLGGWSVGWQGVPAGSAETAVTVAKGLQTAGGSNVTYAASQSDAVKDLSSANAAVVVLGRDPGAEGPNDQRDPTLPSDQQAMVTALKATGKPVVVVLIDDRPDVLGSAASADAVLMAWRPGSQGGNGVADLLYGAANPSGKLPVSWPAQATDQPSDYLYNTMPTTYNGNGAVYQPAYPFGYGLSYSSTTASVSKATRSGNTVQVRVKVSNTGSRAGGVVVPVYASQPVSAVLVPAKRLAGFTRVTLKPGASRTVTVSVPTSALRIVQGDIDASGAPTLEHGQYVFSTGTASDTVTPSATNTVSL